MRLLTIKTNNNEIQINVPENMKFLIGKGGRSKVVENNQIPLGHFLNHSNTDLFEVFENATITELQKLQKLINVTTDSKRAKQVLSLIEQVL